MITFLTHRWMQASAIVLATVCGGCGGPVSDETASSQKQPTAGVYQADKRKATDTPLIAGSAARENRISGNKIEATNQSADRGVPSDLSIPRAVAAGLASPEAKIRLQALEHWDQKDSKLPLDAVFEALEDEDEAVRAKAEAIVEQHWSAEEKKERS